MSEPARCRCSRPVPTPGRRSPTCSARSLRTQLPRRGDRRRPADAFEITARHDRRRDPLRRRRGDGRRPPGDRGLHDRQPPHREGVPGRRPLRRRDRRRGRARGRDGASSSRCSSSTTRRCRASMLSLEGKANQLGAAGARQPARRDAGLRGRPAVRRLRRPARARPGVLLRRHRRPLRGADFQAQGLGQRPRPQLDQGRLARGHDRRRRRRARDPRRCSPPPTRTSRPAAPTSCAASSRRSRSSTPTATAPSTDDDVEARSRAARSRAPSEGGTSHEHAVLRLARAGDEGPRRLRAEGHRPRPQPRRARVRRRAC